jgi:hypothetical protein
LSGLAGRENDSQFERKSAKTTDGNTISTMDPGLEKNISQQMFH